jgi:UrcA family protein
LATAAAVLAISLGTAQAGDEAPTVHIRLDQFDLTTDAGNHALLQKLKYASRQVCNVDEARDGARLELIMRAQQCYKTALENAVVSVRSERLTLLYRASDRVS